MYLSGPFFCDVLCKSAFELFQKAKSHEIFFHMFGKSVIIPNPIISPHEKLFQNHDGTSISSVDHFNIIEKTRTDRLSDPIIISGVNLFLLSSALAPKIIGKRGKIHGARIVKTPEKNYINKSVSIKKSYN